MKRLGGIGNTPSLLPPFQGDFFGYSDNQSYRLALFDNREYALIKSS